MPNSAAYDIATFILDNGIGNMDLSDDSLPLISVGMEPSPKGNPQLEKRALITLFDTGGPASNPAYQRDYPRIQVRTKAATQFGYPSAYDPQQDIKDLILGTNRMIINGTLYVGIWQQGDIGSLAPDYNSKPILVSNYKIVREYDSPNRKVIE